MDLKEWRKKREEGELFTLPSGLDVRVRRVSLLDLAEHGEIPAPLAAMVNAVLDTEVHALTVDDVPEYGRTIDLVVKAVMVSPPVADEPDETHVAVSEIPMKDRLALYNWANQREALRPFPGKTGQPEAA